MKTHSRVLNLLTFELKSWDKIVYCHNFYNFLNMYMKFRTWSLSSNSYSFISTRGICTGMYTIYFCFSLRNSQLNLEKNSAIVIFKIWTDLALICWFLFLWSRIWSQISPVYNDWFNTTDQNLISVWDLEWKLKFENSK